MRTIGVRALKAHLSRVLRDVQDGETVLVTDRGKVIAEVRKPDSTLASSQSAADQALSRMAARGQLLLAEGSPVYRASVLQEQAGLAQELLDAVRGDR